MAIMKSISGVIFLWFSVAGACAAQTVAWRALGESELILVPETHLGSPIERQADRVRAIGALMQTAEIIALEGYSDPIKPELRCADESQAGQHLDQPPVADEYKRWLRIADLGLDVETAFRWTGGDYAKFGYLIDSFSRYALSRVGKKAIRTSYSPESIYYRMAEDLANSTSGKRIEFIESYSDRFSQWCDAPLATRLTMLEATFAMASEWLEIDLAGDSARSEELDRLTVEAAGRSYQILMDCAQRRAVCEIRNRVPRSSVRLDSGIEVERAQVFLPRRNINMTNTLQILKSSRPIVAVVGVAHFPSLLVEGVKIKGILELLRERGFRIEPIQVCDGSPC